MDIKSLDGFVAEILLLNRSEALTSWWELHQAPLCFLSGRGIAAPGAVKCKCNNLPGRLPGKLDMLILFLNLACLPSPCHCCPQCAGFCMPVALQTNGCATNQRKILSMLVACGIPQIFLYSSLMSCQQFSVCFQPARCACHTVSAAFIFVSLCVYLYMYVYIYVCLYINIYISHIYIYVFVCVMLACFQWIMLSLGLRATPLKAGSAQFLQLTRLCSLATGHWGLWLLSSCRLLGNV